MDFAANVFREQGRATRTRLGGVIRIYYLQCIEWNNKIYFLKEIVSCGSGCWTAGGGSCQRDGKTVVAGIK
jgi:hypothetical protein